MTSFSVFARGHENVRATHKNSIELTKEDFLTPKGDCIIGISADKALFELPGEIKEQLLSSKKIKISFKCGGIKDKLTARGHPRLSFESEKSFVIRKSNFVCARTLCVSADKAAKDLDRRLIEKLKEGKGLEMLIEPV